MIIELLIIIENFIISTVVEVKIETWLIDCFQIVIIIKIIELLMITANFIASIIIIVKIMNLLIIIVNFVVSIVIKYKIKAIVIELLISWKIIIIIVIKLLIRIVILKFLFLFFL